jgi:uncharacterized membrane protein
MPFSPAVLLLAVLVLGVALLFVQLELFTLAFYKLGLSRGQATALLFSALAGSLINLPLVRIRGIPPEEVHYPPELAQLRQSMPPYRGITVIAVNVGGCIVPVLFSLYLLTQSEIALSRILLAVAALTAVCYAVARPLPGIGIGMPILVAPVAAVIAGIIFGGEERALTAYVAGTSGVLIGADLLRINDIRRLGAPSASIGGAGTFDGIFFTGIVAVLLA